MLKKSHLAKKQLSIIDTTTMGSIPGWAMLCCSEETMATSALDYCYRDALRGKTGQALKKNCNFGDELNYS